MKRLLSGILILLIFFAPLSVAGAATTPTSTAFSPNSNISGGNSYNGQSISGIGGAIASCVNVGGFLTGAISSLLGKSTTSSSSAPFSFTGGSSQAVSTSDSATQAKLDTMNKTTQCLNGVAYAVAKAMLAQITNQTLKWVNTGLAGNPLYVQNEQSYLGSIQTKQTSSFLNTVQSSDPIFGNALRSAITLSVSGKSDGLINTPLNTPQAQAYNSFQTDFTNGGWDALLNPAYNPIGAFFNAVDTLNTNISTQQTASSNEIQRNNGFLDMKQCTQYANNGQVSSTSNQCSTITSDTIYENCCTGQADEDSAACNSYAKADATAAGNPQCANITDDTVYNQCCGDGTGDSPMCIAYNTSSSADANTATDVTATNVSGQNGSGLINSNTPVCTQYATTTPGSVIANQVNSVTNTPVQQLTYANQINEVLGGFFTTLVNHLLDNGLAGTSTGSAPVVGLGSEGNNTVTNSLSTTSALGYAASGSGDVDTGDFDISRPQQLYNIIESQYNFLSRTEDSKISLDRIIPTIGALDYCIPGPNPDWDTGLDSNWQTFESSIQQASINPTSTPEQIIGALPIVGGFISEIASLFTGSGKPPTLWSATGPLQDKITGNQLSVQRLFYTPSGHGDDIQTSDLLTSLSNAYDLVVNYYDGYGYPSSDGSFDTTPVGAAFTAAYPNDPTLPGFLQEAYTMTDSLTGYNQAVSSIDTQYQQNITTTENDIQQLNNILQQVDAIVASAKATYISQNPTVNVQCLNNAYQTDLGAAAATVTSQEPGTSNIQEEEDAMVEHSLASSSYFYSQIK